LNGLLAPAPKSTPLPIVLLGKVRVCTLSREEGDLSYHIDYAHVLYSYCIL
jgi:hypothetical protein